MNILFRINPFGLGFVISGGAIYFISGLNQSTYVVAGLFVAAGAILIIGDFLFNKK